MKNPLTPSGIELVTFRFVAQHLTVHEDLCKFISLWILLRIGNALDKLRENQDTYSIDLFPKIVKRMR